MLYFGVGVSWGSWRDWGEMKVGNREESGYGGFFVLW